MNYQPLEPLAASSNGANDSSLSPEISSINGDCQRTPSDAAICYSSKRSRKLTCSCFQARVYLSEPELVRATGSDVSARGGPLSKYMSSSVYLFASWRLCVESEQNSKTRLDSTRLDSSKINRVIYPPTVPATRFSNYLTMGPPEPNKSFVSPRDRFTRSQVFVWQAGRTELS